jgi:hypothetical protein
MHGGAHETVCREFEQFARVDDEGLQNRRRVDPCAVFRAHPQTRHRVLEKNGHEAAVPMGAYALIGLRHFAARIADDLHELRRVGLIYFGKDVLGLAEGRSDGLQHVDTDSRDLRLIGEQQGLEFRKRFRPLVAAL